RRSCSAVRCNSLAARNVLVACLTLAYQRGHTMLVALLGYSQIVFTSVLGMALWNDRPTLLGWVGMGLVVASGVVATRSATARVNAGATQLAVMPRRLQRNAT